METLTVRAADGDSLALRRWPGANRPFLLVHGLAGHAAMWDAVAEILSAAGHQVTAVDMRGHGNSAPLPDLYDHTHAVADLQSLLGPMGRDAILVGHGWGGNIAVRVAAGQHLGGLALIEGGWIDLAADFGSWAACAATVRPTDIDGTPIEVLREKLRSAYPDWSDRTLEGNINSLHHRPDGTVERRLPVEAHLRMMRHMYEDPPSRYFTDIEAPTLLLPAIPTDAGRAARIRRRVADAAASIPHAFVHEYPGAHHDLHTERPEQVAADLLILAGAA